MKKIKDVMVRADEHQFILEEISEKPRKLAITDFTVDDKKHVCIDFGNLQDRYLLLDMILITLKELYGADYIKQAMDEFKPYEEIKEIVIRK